MRKIALDLGDARIGIATSDPNGIIASGYETYIRKNYARDLDYIAKFFLEKGADTLVIGLPINMDGTEGERALLSRKFGNDIASYLPLETQIVYVDERMTTIQAEKILIMNGTRRDKRKQVIDKVAATIILQTYLDQWNMKHREGNGK